jgi:hypothetical protein
VIPLGRPTHQSALLEWVTLALYYVYCVTNDGPALGQRVKSLGNDRGRNSSSIYVASCDGYRFWSDRPAFRSGHSAMLQVWVQLASYSHPSVSWQLLERWQIRRLAQKVLCQSRQCYTSRSTFSSSSQCAAGCTNYRATAKAAAEWTEMGFTIAADCWADRPTRWRARLVAETQQSHLLNKKTITGSTLLVLRTRRIESTTPRYDVTISACYHEYSSPNQHVDSAFRKLRPLARPS